MSKRIVYTAVLAIYTAATVFFMPALLAIAFNYTKGPVLNQDGIMFIPFGFAAIAVMLAIGILLWVRFFRRELKDCGNRLKLALICAAAVPAVIAVVLNVGAWESFVDCLAYFGGLNVGSQL